MRHFIQAKEYDMNMHANIQCMNMHEVVWIISSSIEILEIDRMYYWVNYNEVKFIA
jgi:hypothetical protein